MRSINRCLILTIILSFLILIGAGEGKIILGLVEVLAPIEFFKRDTNFSFAGTTDDKAFSSAILALAGQIILIIACLTKKYLLKAIICYIGVSILIFSIIILLINFSNFNDYIFWSAIPFLLSSFFLLIFTTRMIILIIKQSKK